MEKKTKIMQIYALLICAIAIVTLLISTANLIGALIDKNDPVHARGMEQKYSSFENFKMETLQTITKDAAYIPSKEEIVQMYESARTEKINASRHRISRTIMVNSIVGLIAIALFVIHWLVLKRASKV